MATPHTLNHRDCSACASTLEQAMTVEAFEGLPLAAAVKEWLDGRAISPVTAKDYGYYGDRLVRFFGQLTLAEFHVGHLREYQRHRVAQKVGAVAINHELGFLAQLLKEAKRWQRLKPYYKPLRIPRSLFGIALKPEEAEELFKIGRRREKWRVALCASIISAYTSAGPGEIRRLRLGDIDLANGLLHIQHETKNQYRVRSHVLNKSAQWAVRQLVARANKRGSVLPEHYLLPHRSADERGAFDPTRPQTHWYAAWRAIRKELVKKYPHLATLRPYDLRHTNITWLLSDPATSERTAIEIAGWASAKMVARYSHQRIEIKRQAVDRLEALVTISESD